MGKGRGTGTGTGTGGMSAIGTDASAAAAASMRAPMARRPTRGGGCSESAAAGRLRDAGGMAAARTAGIERDGKTARALSTRAAALMTWTAQRYADQLAASGQRCSAATMQERCSAAVG